MNAILKPIVALLTTLIFTVFSSSAQVEETKAKIAFNPFDGAIVLGYIDNGAYINFTGPNLSFTKGKSKVLIGMLPSLRYKEDHNTIKNSPITPNLGVGITYCYRKFVFQVPLYYNAKTSTTNGVWNVGVGVGFRLK